MFERVISECPASDKKIFYVMYANLEEEYGLLRHAMEIYDRACKDVPPGLTSKKKNHASGYFVSVLPKKKKKKLF